MRQARTIERTATKTATFVSLRYTLGLEGRITAFPSKTGTDGGPGSRPTYPSFLFLSLSLSLFFSIVCPTPTSHPFDSTERTRKRTLSKGAQTHESYVIGCLWVKLHTHVSVWEFLARVTLSSVERKFENFHSPRETEILSESLIYQNRVHLRVHCLWFYSLWCHGGAKDVCTHDCP